jgi:hypothetical protein
VAIIAVVWMVFMIIVMMFPSSLVVDSASMNYSCVVLGGTLSFAVGYYYIPKVGGKYWFEGPVKNVPSRQYTEDSESDGGKSNVEDMGSK